MDELDIEYEKKKLMEIHLMRKYATLKELGEIITGNTPKTSEVNNYSSDDIPFFKPSDLHESEIWQLEESENYISNEARDKARIVPKGTVLCTCIGIIGKIGITTKECAFNQQINAVIPDPQKVNQSYLAFAISSMKHYMQSKANAAVVPIINKTQFSDLLIQVPFLDEQLKIARHLKLIERLIANRQQALSILDTLVKSRFIEMFGDPVTNSKEYPVYKLSDITTSRLGKMLDKKRQTGDNKYPYLANYNVQWFRFELDNLNEMDFDEVDRKEFELRNGDLLVCEGGEVGRCAIWRGNKENCYFQKALHRVRCDRNYIIPEYLGWTFYWHSQYNGFIDAISGVSTIAHLPGDKLKQLQIIVPPLGLQNQFADFVALTDKSKLAVKKSIEVLQTLKASLMQEYFG